MTSHETTRTVAARTAVAVPAVRPSRSGRRERWLLGAGPALLLLIGWAVLTVGNRWFVNPDGVVYASLAQRIADGHPAQAVTGYWAPLLPTLAAPLVALGLAPFTALRLVLLVAALVALPVLRSMCRRACGSDRVAAFCTVIAVPLLVSAAVFGLYPELLLASLLLLCCRLILTGRGSGRAVVGGLVGAAAYLAKPVGLPFVVGFVLIVLVARLLAGRRAGPAAARVERRRLLSFHLIVLAVVVVAVAPWAVAISLHVGHPTLSTAGEFNARLVTPGAWGNPLSFPGLHRPVPPAMTPWEDPSLLTVPHQAADAAAPVTPLDRLQNAYRQGRVAVGSLLRRWTPVLLLAVAGLVITLRRAVTSDRDGTVDAGSGPAVDPAAGSAVAAGCVAGGSEGRRIVVGSVLAAAMFAGGMSLIVVVERYLWFPMLALLPAASVAIETARARWAGRPGRRSVVTAVTAVVAALLLVVVVAGLAPVGLRHWGQDREVWQLASRLQATATPAGVPAGGSAGSNRCGLSGGLAGNQDWERSQLLASLCGVDYLGLTGPDQSPSAQLAQLRRVDARHLVVWSPSGAVLFDVTADQLRQHAAR